MGSRSMRSPSAAVWLAATLALLPVAVPANARGQRVPHSSGTVDHGMVAQRTRAPGASKNVRGQLAGTLITIDWTAQVLVVRPLPQGADMVLGLDDESEVIDAGAPVRWQALSAGQSVLVTFFRHGPTWTADRITITGRAAPQLPDRASAGTRGDVEAPLRTRRFGGTTGPLHTVTGYLTAIDSSCQAFAVKSSVSGTDWVFAVDDQTKIVVVSGAHGRWSDLRSNTHIRVVYFRDGGLEIADQVSIEP
jgi:hypothetical protein